MMKWGRIEVNIASTTERYFGNLIIRRTSHKSNFTIWEDVKIITLYEASDLNINWYDYTAESGVWYKYCVQKCTSQGARGLVVLTEKACNAKPRRYLSNRGRPHIKS